MNRFQLRYFLCLLVLPFLLASCGKDDDDDVSPNVSMLTAGVWEGSAIIIEGEDVTADILESDGFDWTLYTTEFEREGTYNESYDGDPQIDGKWEFQNNERIIVFEKGTDDEYYVVVAKLDEDELWYVQEGVEFRFMRR
ncbi:hypothetical protein JAO76_09970 [Pontibacter sp. BT310]|uniref:Lipocalin-like domain-containing protein n=1 Tax=Pontibacter populi TaxID=890055 RepID=A0ABS6XBS7_9BACT|nr:MULTISPECIES: hypothetical protein [Pontibacter]MBJ6118518.1 hypothetical protein [Pontibacter sp. BT310]MBR0570947.1 hypothetical protein [Microvirga sp. STS03]MBW3365372.1 hypothetical protein [Pontibacter populi]